MALLPSYDVATTIADFPIEEGNENCCSMIGEMLLSCYSERKQLRDFGLVVVWVTYQLKAYSIPSVRVYLLETLCSLFKIEASQTFMGEIIEQEH